MANIPKGGPNDLTGVFVTSMYFPEGTCCSLRAARTSAKSPVAASHITTERGKRPWREFLRREAWGEDLPSGMLPIVELLRGRMHVMASGTVIHMRHESRGRQSVLNQFAEHPRDVQRWAGPKP